MNLTSLARPVLTAAEMRAHEQIRIAAGTPARRLMERAGAAAADAVMRYDAPRRATVLCGPGNNGGDGYVVARHLRDAGVVVAVAASRPAKGEPATAAAADWDGPVVLPADAAAGGAFIDALFGTGLTGPLRAEDAAAMARLGGAAQLRVALDLPSGVGTDDGADLGCPIDFELTVAFGTLKPAHLLSPSRARCGRVVVADIGLGPVGTKLTDNPRPAYAALDASTHKFARGAVLIVAGPAGQGGAARLAALAALRTGAGLVTLAVPDEAMTESAARLDAVMLRRTDDAAALRALLADPRLTALAIGPGLGHDQHAHALAIVTLGTGKPIVLDGDIFTLFAGNAAGLAVAIRGPGVLTPHEGEFARLFGELPGSKVERARTAARLIGAVVVYKGPDTVIAAPDGRARINAHAAPWLATAGSGDVLAGIVTGLLAQGHDAFDSACAAVWRHGDIGIRGGRGLIADDMPGLLHG